MKTKSTKTITKAGYFIIDALKQMPRTPETDARREQVESTMVVLDSTTERLAELKARKSEARKRFDRDRRAVKQAALGGGAVLALTEPTLAADLPLGKVHEKMDPLLAGEAVMKVAQRGASATAKSVGDVVRSQLEDARATEQELEELDAEIEAAQSELTDATFAFSSALRTGEFHIRKSAPKGSPALRQVKRRYTPLTQGAKGKRAKKADKADANPVALEKKPDEQMVEPGPAVVKFEVTPAERAVTAGEEQKDKAA